MAAPLSECSTRGDVPLVKRRLQESHRVLGGLGFKGIAVHPRAAVYVHDGKHVVKTRGVLRVAHVRDVLGPHLIGEEAS